ncbi:MAG: hypothetical protein QNJ47_00730 [Nostocaceae cyanobacterium]|nr:hypothetical protein [Nostocaceae cyanobacterium]
MANIKVNEINPAGAELFLDSDSFLNELSESEEIISINGGLTTPRCLREEILTLPVRLCGDC